MLVEYILNFITLETHFIVVAMATYFPPRFLWKMKKFQINPSFFLKLFLKQELKKISRMFIKRFTHIMVAMATYFPQNFCEKLNQLPIFFIIIFKIRIIKKLSGKFTKCFTHIIMVAMVTYFFQNFCEKLNFSNQAHCFFILFLKQEF